MHVLLLYGEQLMQHVGHEDISLSFVLKFIYGIGENVQIR